MNDPGPLSLEQKEQLAVASGVLHALLRPARMARANAWAMAAFGVLTILWGWVAGGGLWIGGALIAVAANEFRGVRVLSALDPDGARILGWNQVVLAVVVCGYCAVVIARAGAAPDPSMAEIEKLAGFSSDLVAGLTAVVYGGVAVVVTIVQACLTRWHFRAGRRMASFVDETPPWIVDVLRASAARSR